MRDTASRKAWYKSKDGEADKTSVVGLFPLPCTQANNLSETKWREMSGKIKENNNQKILANRQS